MQQTKKSTYKLLFHLKRNELKKNGNAPIMARITIDGTPKTMGTKLEIDPNIWDLKFGRVEGKSTKALFLGVGVMEDSLLKVFKKNNEDFGKMVAKGERSESTYYKYKIVYNHVAEFIKNRYHRDDMAFRELTCDFIREFDFFLRIDKELYF